MKEISADVLESLQKDHPIEATIWERWIERGEARVVQSESD